LPGKKYTESELVALLKQKDKTAFSDFYDNYSGALYSVILRILNGDEENSQDVLQDAFVKIWKNIESYDSTKGTLFTWILNIARNTAIDKTRQRKNYSIQSLEESVRIVDSKFNHTSNTDKIGLKEAIKNLKPEYRSIIDLAYFGGYTQEEISSHLNLPLGTVKTRVRSALIELRKIFNVVEH
jgi:RNA polymerase sigma-70 factor (ECF subfamily)